MPTAKTKVPIPMEPPNDIPAITTTISNIVRAIRTLTPRSARPIINPSRGPGPSPAPMYNAEPNAITTKPPTSIAARANTLSGSPMNDFVRFTTKPI